MAQFVVDTVVFEDSAVAPFLRAISSPSLGLHVHPQNQQLRDSSTMHLKKTSPATTMITPVKYTMPISALTVDKLGVKLYDRASAVIAELLSNSYDADATEATVSAPLGKYLATVVDGELSDRGYALEVSDNGLGMTPNEMNSFFLPVGMERRDDPNRGSTSKRFARQVMGRKGVGKLAPFGICKVIEVKSAGGDKITYTTEDGRAQIGYLTSHIILNYDDIVRLGRVPSKIYQPQYGAHDCTISPETGTTITLRQFYRKRIPDIDVLTRQIAQRFGIPSENWTIVVADSAPGSKSKPRAVGKFDVQEMPNTKLTFNIDKTVTGPDGRPIPGRHAGFYGEGNQFYPLSGWMGYSKHPYRDELMAGVRIYCRGKIASQTSVFNRKAGFTGEHNIRSYLVGELHADWLDDEQDLILTDRRDILWSDRLGEQFQEWGQEMVAMIGTFARDPSRKATLDLFLENGNVEDRIDRHFGYENKDMRRQALVIAKKFGRTMSRDDVNDASVIDDLVELAILLAPHMTLDQVMREATDSADNPISFINKCLRIARFSEVWSFGRIANDRIRVLQRLRALVDQPSTQEADLQNLITEAPWLINPEWVPVTANQTFKTLQQEFQKHYMNSKQLREFGEPQKKPDFVLTCQQGTIQIVEIKAPRHTLTKEELRRIVVYHDCMEDFLEKSGNAEFAAQFSKFEITLVCDHVRLSGYDAHAMTGLKPRLKHITWGTFLRRTEQIHQDFLREAERLASVPTEDG